MDSVWTGLNESVAVPLSVNVGVENKLSDEHPDRDEDAVWVFWTKVWVAVFVLIGVDVADKDNV